MGIEGVTTPKGVDDAVPPAIVIIEKSCVPPCSDAVELTSRPLAVCLSNQQLDATRDGDEEEESRRRISIPPSFVYGSEVVTPHPTTSERRWRSFDCYSNSSCSSSSRASTLAALDARIQQVGQELSKQSTNAGIRKRDRLKALLSTSKRERVELKQMEHLASVAATKRSLTILNDMKTIVLTLEDRPYKSPTPLDSDGISDYSSRHSVSSYTSVSALQELLNDQDSLVLRGDTEQRLAEDVMHEVLVRQSQWLHQLTALYKEKSEYSSSRLRRVSSSPSVALQQFLSEFVDSDGGQRVPYALDLPTRALMQFEKLVSRFHLLKPAHRKALNEMCHDAMNTMTQLSSQLSNDSPSCFLDKSPKDVINSLVIEMTETIAKEAWVCQAHRKILQAFVEQMVYGRLSCACYRPVAIEIDEQNLVWRENVLKCRALELHDVGLPKDVLPMPSSQELSEGTIHNEDGEIKGIVGDSNVFSKSIKAFESIPMLVPSCVLAAFMNTIRVLHDEAIELLTIPNGCVSADVLLPLLVYVLSRSETPHLFAQIHLLETYAIDSFCDGSEAAYYVACLQAAVGYITSGEFEKVFEK